MTKIHRIQTTAWGAILPTRVLPARIGRLTQGTIFSSARAERYGSCEVFGLVITARCDIAQDKFPLLNYVPVVELEDWLAQDGLEILLARVNADIDDRLKTAMTNVGISHSVLYSQSPRDLLEKVFRASNANKSLRTAERKFSELVDRYELIKSTDALSLVSVRALYDSSSTFAKYLIRELALNRLTGYYFLQNISPDGPTGGYVALLRESTFLPRELAKHIGNGIDQLDPALNRQPQWLSHLSFERSDFAMPVGEISSPMIEHILQIFSQLFGRIGLDDIEEAYLSNLIDKRPKERVS